jgi:beta-N-acetylhexosaminidase
MDVYQSITARIAGATLAAALALTACSGQEASAPPQAESAGPGCSPAAELAQWPLQRRIAQMLMGGVNTDDGEIAVDSAVRAVQDQLVGGVNLLGGNSAVYSDNELALARDAGGPVPPFLAIDQEGGRVQRLADQTGYLPSPRQMAQTMTSKEVQRGARKIGRTMRRLSLNMNLAPVVDVSDQQPWEVIGDRSFGEDPDTVIEYAGAFAEGLRRARIVPVVKHFPGLGSGTGNTDFEPAQTPPLADLRERDLLPYQQLLAAQPVAVMTTNASVPGLTRGMPASLSRKTYRLLREELGFDGVVMTDSLSAAAIVAETPVEDAVKKSLVAGADIALWDGLSQAGVIRRDLVRAVRKGRLPEEQVNASVLRILQLKGVDLCAGR